MIVVRIVNPRAGWEPAPDGLTTRRRITSCPQRSFAKTNAPEMRVSRQIK
jgi:hypothetical protein